MTTRKYSSRSQQTTLTAAVTSGAITIPVLSASTLLGGATINSGETFTVVIDPDTALEEIVEVTGSSSNNLSVTRAVDMAGATAQDHSAGAVVRHMIIGRDLREANLHIEATAAYNDGTSLHTLHGLGSTDGDIVGTAKAQTLTNKTLTSPTITGTGAIAGTFTGNLTGNVTGNASTATTLATARDFQIVGDVEASAQSFNGSGNITLTTAIATGAIVNADVNASAAIAYSKLNLSGAITSADIANGTIVDADINASAAIAKTKIAGTAVTIADSGTVTSAMIADGTIVDGDINASAAIAKTKLNLGGTITSADLVDGTIVNADINASAGIALSKLAVDPLDRANHTGTQTASTVSDFDTQVRTSRLDQMAAPTGSVSANSQKITNLATPTNSGDAVPLGYITAQKGAVNGIAPLDGSGKIPIDHIPASAIAEVFVVNSQANMLALSAGVGDIAVRSDLNKSFILQATPATTLGNWVELLTPTDAVLSVDGLTGAVNLTGVYLNATTGTLLGNLAAGGFKVTGLGTPTNTADAATKAYVDTVAGSATAAASSATAAAASYDSFDDRYLGAKSTPPTVDNDGNTLLVGAIYWNTVSNAMFVWSGTAWGSISSTADIYRYRYTATGGETSESGPDDNGLTLSYLPGKEQVYLNGVLLVRTTDYNATSGTSITSLAALAAGDILEVITFTAFDLANVISPTVIDAKGDLIAGVSADTIGRLAVGTNGQYLQANSATSTGLQWATVTGYSAPTIGSTAITSGATITTLSGVTDVVLTGAGSIQDQLTLLLMGAL